MERIVLGYDGSDASLAALEWVAHRAARARVVVGVVTVVPRLGKVGAIALDRWADAEARLRARVPGADIELHRVQGAAVDSLADVADQADLLVIGINPGHPLRAVVAGAMPLRLSSLSRVPVAMIPAGWTAGSDAVTVGIADDGSSGRALAMAAQEAAGTRTPLRLVHSWLMPTPSFSGATVLVQTTEAAMAEHRRVLDDALSWVIERYESVPVATELIRDARSAALLRFAGRSSALVIGTHHRGVLAGNVLGSVAQEVLWHAECPVIVVPNEPPHSSMEKEG